MRCVWPWAPAPGEPGSAWRAAVAPPLSLSPLPVCRLTVQARGAVRDAHNVAARPAEHTPDGPRSLIRCSSTSSRIRPRPRPPSPLLRRSPPPPEAAAAAASSDQQVVREAALAAREQRRVQARLLNRSWSGARRALKGLRFISRTTTDADGGTALWRTVEERFNALAADGLLARDDFVRPSVRPKWP